MEHTIIKTRGVRLLLAGILTLLSLWVAAYDMQNPDNTPPAPRSDAAIQADFLFWQVFHGGDYESIPLALNALTAAYLADPNDAITAGHIGGGLHLWRISEQARMVEIPATITDHAVLARKYLQQSIRKKPDVRYLGQVGGMMMAEGTFHDDKKLVRRGLRKLFKSAEAYPEFNLFTIGYLGSRMSSDSGLFKKGLKLQWKGIDLCIEDKFDRVNPNMSPYMHLATTEGQKRVCWNSWVAPHNFEGFFMNMGDLLVKSGDWITAQKIYENAKFSPDYDWWKFRDVLEQRILDAQDNVARFNASPDTSNGTFLPVMSQSAFACMACHQE